MTKQQPSSGWRRRDFLWTSARSAAALAAASVLPGRRVRALGSAVAPSPFTRVTGAETINHMVDLQTMEALVLRAVEAAKSAGARYVDARVTRTVQEKIFPGFKEIDSGRFMTYPGVNDKEFLEIGVRALVDDGWGFAASTYWDLDEAAQLAQTAVSMARINAKVFPQRVELGTYPVAKGQWTTPIRIDPFQISPEEKYDFYMSYLELMPRGRVRESGVQYEAGFNMMNLFRQERMVATSDGALFGHTLYNSGGEFAVRANVNTKSADGKPGIRESSRVLGRGIRQSGAGWELFLDAKLEEQLPQLMAEAEEDLWIPMKPVDVGRYEVVMSADIVAKLVSSSLGNATQLDRALGMEANAGGTSYLGPEPEEFLGKPLGATAFSVFGNRSVDKGLATVKWDDEGVEPETFPIIEQGVFVDYQTTRESAAWLAPWYQSRQRPVRSHGCAAALLARDIPMQHTPNLSMASDPATSATFDDMVKNTRRGIAFVSGYISIDFQSRTGYSFWEKMREIVDGKLGARLSGASILFDSTQLWKTLLEIGGPGSAELFPTGASKGEPEQSHTYSVEAVPARFKDVTVMDSTRKT